MKPNHAQTVENNVTDDIADFDIIQQYRILLSRYGLARLAEEGKTDQQLLADRIEGTQAFIDAMIKRFGMVSPLMLTPIHFFSVLQFWNSLQLSKNDLHLRGRVAAWLFEICIGHDECPYPIDRETLRC
jgi:hypothetical protein